MVQSASTAVGTHMLTEKANRDPSSEELGVAEMLTATSKGACSSNNNNTTGNCLH